MVQLPRRDVVLRRLLHEEKVASFDASFEAQLKQGLFQAGRTAFYGPVGYWETYRFKAIQDFAWDVVPLPRRRQAATAVAMQGFVVPRTARHPELAYRFMRALGDMPLQARAAEVGNGVPGLIAAACSPAFLKPDVAPDSEQVCLDGLPHARLMPPLADWQPEWGLAWAWQWARIWCGKAPGAQPRRHPPHRLNMSGIRPRVARHLVRFQKRIWAEKPWKVN